jgi:hypothetical protein
MTSFEVARDAKYAHANCFPFHPSIQLTKDFDHDQRSLFRHLEASQCQSEKILFTVPVSRGEASAFNLDTAAGLPNVELWAATWFDSAAVNQLSCYSISSISLLLTSGAAFS